MKTTRFVVEYHTPSSLGVGPASLPVMSTLLNTIHFFMDVDATCAKDAVEAVLAARPNASIVAVRAQKTDYEKKDEA